jgi:hypothetical protein
VAQALGRAARDSPSAVGTEPAFLGRPNSFAHGDDAAGLSDVTDDPRRSYEALTLDDLARLGRLGALEVDEFFSRNRRLAAWRGQHRFTALVQGGAEHYLRHQRGIWDLDIAVFFAQHPGLPARAYLRRSSRQWDWVRQSSAAAHSTTRTT